MNCDGYRSEVNDSAGIGAGHNEEHSGSEVAVADESAQSVDHSPLVLLHDLEAEEDGDGESDEDQKVGQCNQNQTAAVVVRFLWLLRLSHRFILT